MEYLKYLIVFPFVLFNSAQSKMCDVKDVGCMTRGSASFYKRLVDGIEGLTKPVDPLHVDEIKGEIENMKYELTNVRWTGFRSCKVEEFGLNIEAGTYYHIFYCSNLTVNYNYEAKSNVGSSEITELGTGSVNAVDYEIKLNGSYGKAIAGNDPIPHLYIISNYIETIPKGKLTVETKSDNANISKFAEILLISENNNEIDEKYFRSPIMETFMTLIMKNVDTVIRTMRPEEIFPKEE